MHDIFFAMAAGGRDVHDLFCILPSVHACMHVNPCSHYAKTCPVFFSAASCYSVCGLPRDLAARELAQETRMAQLHLVDDPVVHEKQSFQI